MAIPSNAIRVALGSSRFAVLHHLVEARGVALTRSDMRYAVALWMDDRDNLQLIKIIAYLEGKLGLTVSAFEDELFDDSDQ
jgi:hypothetical protein